jgi:hypothetical protein
MAGVLSLPAQCRDFRFSSTAISAVPQDAATRLPHQSTLETVPARSLPGCSTRVLEVACHRRKKILVRVISHLHPLILGVCSKSASFLPALALCARSCFSETVVRCLLLSS